ncbi:MAG TPA: cupin domain-containing protein [bacterium]|nr:cupin domain-containing protein [bacterium]
MRISRVGQVVLIGTVLAAAGGVMVSYAAPLGPVIVGTAKAPISVTAGDYDLISQVIDLPPGAMIPKHYHPGPAVVQVLTGTLTLTDATGPKVIKAPAMFNENVGNVHWGANKGSVPVRVAVSYLVPRGKDAIVFVK